jgi:hypothetical protein
VRFVQLLLTAEQAELVAAALRDTEAAIREEGTNEETTSEEVANNERVGEAARAVGRLSLLFADAAENPSKYPPQGKLASTVRDITRRAKGAAQPEGRKNKRKARQERRIATAKERRRYRREMAEGFNKAREIMEQEAAEAAEFQAEIEARISDQPKYNVVDAYGNLIVAGVPAEFVKTEEGESAFPAAHRVGGPMDLLLPGSHEKAAERGD